VLKQAATFCQLNIINHIIIRHLVDGVIIEYSSAMSKNKLNRYLNARTAHRWLYPYM
jgi:hypothetical protein